MLFSILIPVWNDEQNLHSCLRSLFPQDLRDCEILVCDDGSDTPVTLPDLPYPGYPCRLVRQENRGPAAARNMLASLAVGEYLFFIDADTLAGANLMQRAREVIRENPAIAAFFGSYDSAPAHRNVVSSYKNLLHHYIHQQSARRRVSTFWCGCGVIRRDLFLSSGGMSESFGSPSIEDIELGMRLSSRGVRAMIVPDLMVKHVKRWTLKSWLYTDVVYRAIPWIRLMRHWRRWESQLNFVWSQRIAAVAAVLAFVALPAAFLWPALAWFGVPLLGLFLYVNRGFFGLVASRCGLRIAAACIGLHIVYALCCVACVCTALFYPPLSLTYRPALETAPPDGDGESGRAGRRPMEDVVRESR